MVLWEGKKEGPGQFVQNLTLILDGNSARVWQQDWHGARLRKLKVQLRKEGCKWALRLQVVVLGRGRNSEVVALNLDLRQQGGLPGGKYILAAPQRFIAPRKRWQLLCHL